MAAKKIKELRTEASLSTSKRKQLLTICYERLNELIPECGNEVTLLKCIEILEKQGGQTDDSKRKRSIIAESLERINKLEEQE